MIRINLLPPEYAAAQARKEQRIIFGTIGIAAFVFLLLFWIVKERQAAALQTKINDADAELRKYQAIVSQIETIENEKKQMLAKRDVIRNLNKSRLLYPVFFEDFLPIIPSDVWVSNVQIKDDSGGMKVTMTCNALSNYALATWITNLQQSSNFANIDLGAISYVTGETGSVLNFSLSVSYQHRGPFPLADYN